MELAGDVLVALPHRRWWFGDTVGFEALWNPPPCAHRDRWRAFAFGFCKAWAAKPDPMGELDFTAPGHVMCSMHEETGDAQLLDSLQRLADFVTSRPRLHDLFVTFERTPLHPSSSSEEQSAHDAELLEARPPGVFIDTLHFDPPLLCHLGRLLSDAELTDLGVQQALGYIDLLQDERSGLFAHFRLRDEPRMYGFAWGRGQGWALLGLLDVLDQLEASHPARPRLEASVVAACRGLRNHQRSDGDWNAVVTEPESGVESSTAAFAVAAFSGAVRRAILPVGEFQASIDRAWDACLTHLDDSGRFLGVSAAVGCCTVDSHYWKVPINQVVPWGQGPLLLATAAVDDEDK